MQITIDAYAKRFKMSKEMIHAKLRAGRLEQTTVDGTVYIKVEEPEKPSDPALRSTAGAVILLYQRENAQLKERISMLEEKIDRLIGEKEQMLREERDRIEAIYTARDEQLRAFLELINAKMLQQAPQAEVQANAAAPAVETAGEIDVTVEPSISGQIELRHYLSLLGHTPPERKRIKKRFAKAYGHDIRVVQHNGEFILDFSKYDYSDLIAS